MDKQLDIMQSREIFEKISPKEIDYDRINKSIYAIELNKFINKMNHKYDYVDKRIMTNNINTVDIKKHSITKDSYYYYCNNTISLSRTPDIYHELFHLSSSIYLEEGNQTFLGFQQSEIISTSKQIAYSINYGLNEGYTQLLAERNFNTHSEKYYSYEIEKFYARMIEIIIGEKEMTKAYFEANLIDLIDKLSIYQDEDTIVYLFESIDYISNYGLSFIHKLSPIFRKNLISKFHDCNEILINTYYNKLVMNKNNYPKSVIIKKLKNYMLNFYIPSYEFSHYYGVHNPNSFELYEKAIIQNSYIRKK